LFSICLADAEDKIGATIKFVSLIKAKISEGFVKINLGFGKLLSFITDFLI
jgi:hypothetical protein